MEQKATTATDVAQPPQLTLIAERADDFLFDTLDAERFSELEFFTSDDGKLLVTTTDADSYVSLVASGPELEFEEVDDVNEGDLTEVEIADPRPTDTDSLSRPRLRGD